MLFISTTTTMNRLTMPTDWRNRISQHSWPANTILSQKLSLLSEMKLLRLAFFKLICATKARTGPCANQGSASHNSHHVHVILPVTPPTSPCPTLSMHSTVWCHKRWTLEIIGLKWVYLLNQIKRVYACCTIQHHIRQLGFLPFETSDNECMALALFPDSRYLGMRLAWPHFLHW